MKRVNTKRMSKLALKTLAMKKPLCTYTSDCRFAGLLSGRAPTIPRREHRLDRRFGTYSVLVCVALTNMRFATRRDIEADLLTVVKLAGSVNLRELQDFL